MDGRQIVKESHKENKTMFSESPESEIFIENEVKQFNNGLGSRWKIWRRRRYRVVLMIFLGEAVKSILRSNLSIAVFPMTENYTITSENGTEKSVSDFDWDVKTRGFLLSVFYYGYIATNIPGGILAAKYGGARVFGYGIILTSVTTLLTPVLAHIHLYVLIALRIFEGLCEGILEPSMELLLSRWIPVEERSSVIATVVSGSLWGHSASFATSSAIGYYWGWEAIFYCTGSVGVVWFIASQILVKEHPTLDDTIPNSEVEYIQRSLNDKYQVKRKVSSIPFVKIFISLPVWANISAQFAIAWCISMFLTQSPAYLKDVLKFDYKNSGYVLSLPFAGQILVLYFIAPFTDILTTKKILTLTAARKIFVCGSLSSMALFSCLIQLTTSATLAVVCLIGILLGNVACHVQIYANALDMAPKYSSFLVGLYVTTFSLGGIITPTFIGYLTQSKTAEEWHTVFSIQSGICLAGAIIYGVFASGQLQPWATEKDSVIPDSENQEF